MIRQTSEFERGRSLPVSPAEPVDREIMPQGDGGDAGSWIGAHPAACLGAALLLGMVIGWLVKRR